MSLPFGLKWPSELHAAWQSHAREWRLIGNDERADKCQELAEYWGSGCAMLLPWRLNRARAAQKYLDTHRVV